MSHKPQAMASSGSGRLRRRGRGGGGQPPQQEQGQEQDRRRGPMLHKPPSPPSTLLLVLLLLPPALAAHSSHSHSHGHNAYPQQPPPPSAPPNAPPAPFHRRGGGSFFPPHPMQEEQQQPQPPHQWTPPPPPPQQPHPQPPPLPLPDGQAKDDAESASFRWSAVPPRETALYERLGVAPNATMKQIGRAYRRRARELHPDKRRIDAEEDEEGGGGTGRGTKEFVALTEAYALLSAHATRLQYHYHGLAAAEATAAMAATAGGVGEAPAAAAAAAAGGAFPYQQQQQQHQPPAQQPQPPQYHHHAYFKPPPPAAAAAAEAAAAAAARQGQEEGGDALFGMVDRYFGGARFRHLTGPLPTNWLVSPGTRPLFDAFDHDARIHQLALTLAGRLAPLASAAAAGGMMGAGGGGTPYTAGGRHHHHLAAFERSAFEEAWGLRAESMGPQLLGVLGFAYERCGRKALRRLRHTTGHTPTAPTTAASALDAAASGASAAGLFFSSEAAVHHVKGKARAVGNYLNVASSGLRLLLQLRARAAHGYGPRSGQASPVTPALLDALWAMNKVELERAVACACKRVLRDPTQTLAALEARAQGLVVLGQAFSAVGRMGVGGGGGLR